MSKVLLLPTLPVIAITKNDATQYSFDPFNGSFDFRVQSMTCSPPVDSQGGTFELDIVSSDATNASMNSLLANFENGNAVTIYIGKSDSGKVKIFTGMIRDIEITEPNKNLMQVTLSGPDWWSDIAKNRVCSFARIQNIGADGISYDPTDTNATVGQIATDLISLASSYSIPDVTAAQQGITVNPANIDPSLLGISGIKVPQFIANYEKLDDKLSELDVWGNSIHYFDPDGNFYMRPAAIVPTSDGAWLFTDSQADPLITSWANGQVGYIAPGPTYKYTVQPYKYRLIGTGGNQASIDQKQETNSGSTQLSSTWLATKFQPTFITAFTIQLYLQAFYAVSPTQDIQVMIVQDKGGTPTGTVIANVNISRSTVSTGGGWVSINVGQQYQTSTPYWIVIVGNTGFDGTNGYNWFSGGSGLVTATSSDGINWTPSTGVGYMFRALTSVPIRVIMPGFSASPTTKVFHEDIYQQPYITDTNALKAYLLQLNKMTNFKKEIFTCSIYNPDIAPLPFSSVLLSKVASGLAITSTLGNYYVLGQVTYNYEGGTTGATGAYWIKCQLVRFTVFP